MGASITTQDAVVTNLVGQLTVKDEQGNIREINIGDTIKAGEQLIFPENATFNLTYEDGTSVDQTQIALPTVEQQANSNEAVEVDNTNQIADTPVALDPEIAALQAQILAGEDPTEGLPETAAGAGTPGNEGGSDFVSLTRNGDETLANAGWDTAGFTQATATTAEALAIPDIVLDTPTVSSATFSIFEANMPEGSDPSALLNRLASNIRANAEAGIDILKINGITIIDNGQFVGPLVINTANGVLTITSFNDATGQFDYDYNLDSSVDHNVSDQAQLLFNIELIDGAGNVANGIITINIIDDQPTSSADINSVAEDQGGQVLGNLLSNDTLGADSAEVTAVTNSQGETIAIAGATSIQGTFGVLIVFADGSYTYQLDNSLAAIQSLAEGEQLTDIFTYQLTDGDGDIVNSPLTITITGTNDAPETNALQTLGDEDTLITVPALSGSDLDGQVVSFVIDSLPANGTLMLNGVAVTLGMTVLVADAANLTFMPDENWNGETTFNYHSVDNDDLADATPATVTITIDSVNDAPETDDLATTGDEDTLIAVPALSGSDLDGQVVSFVIDSLPANGTLMLNGVAVTLGMTVLVADAANLTFMPDENWNGETTFTYHSVDNDDLADATPATVTITIDSVNDAPETDDLATSGNEDTLITVPALSGSDLDGQVVSFVIDSLPANGTLMLNGVAVTLGMTVLVADAANLTFMPDENWNGETTFTYHSVDNDDLADATPATVTITIDSVNDAPETDNLATTGDEDTLIAVPALSGSDLDGQVVSFVIDSLPANGTLMLNGMAVSIGMTVLIADAANLTFMPDENWNGETTFTYHSVDNDDLADATPATVTITIDSVNDAPETDDLATTGDEDTLIAVPALSGSDLDGQVVSFVIDSLPANGTLMLNGVAVTLGMTVLVADAANLTFMPDTNWNGETTFTYHSVDNDDLADATPATVTITIDSVNDAPETDNLATTGDEDTLIAVPALSGSDLDGQVVSFVIDSLPANGTLMLNGVAVTLGMTVLVADAANLTFMPDENWNGETTFTYHSVDNDDLADATPATVTITIDSVNDAPETDDLATSGNEDTLIAVPALSGSDLDGQVVSFVIDSLPANGTLMLNGMAVSIGMTVLIADAANLTFMPDANWNGETTFTYHSVDNDDLADATPATVTITIDSVNDAPETDDLATTGDEDTLIAVPALSGSDLDGQVVSFVIDSLPANGTLMLNGMAVSIGMTVLIADAANLTFMPDANWNGETTFTYHSVDNDDLADATPATVTITVDSVNDAPETDNLATTGDEDTLIAVPALSGSDLDGQVVSFVIDSLPANGTLMLNGMAVSIGMTVLIADAANLTFMPDENWNGETTFTYHSVDNDDLADATPATVTITIDSVNDAPETDDLATTGDEDTLIAVPALSGSDLDGQVVSFVIDSLPANGTLMLNGVAVTLGMTVLVADAANLTFMPDTNWNGETTFTYHSVDNDDLADATPATVTITIDSVNDAPETDNLATTGDEDTLIAVPALSGSDLDGQVVSFVIDSLPANGTLMLNGVAVTLGMTVLVADAANLTFMPDENWNGETTFTYHSVDNDDLADATPATVTITIDSVNDAPETDDLATTGDEDTLIAVPALSGSDLDGQVVSFVIDSLPANGTLMLNGVAVTLGMTVLVADAANLTFMPDENWNGETTFTYHSVDNDDLADATPATVTITIDSVNDAPETDDLATSGNEDTLITVPALSGSDLDGQVVSFVIDSLPANGTLMLNGVAVTLGMTVLVADAANLTFMPDTNWNGETTFTYHSVDNDDLADATPATVTITIDSVNDAPEITNIDPARVSEEGLLYGIEDDNTGDADTTNEVSTSGIISFTDVDSSSFDVLISDPVGLTSGGEPVDVWERDGNTWTGSTQNGLLVMTIIIGEVEGTSPDYTVGYQITLNANIDHPSNNDEDILQFNLGVTINDMLGNSIPSELLVTIEDDSPIDEVDESAELSILNAIGQSISGDLFAPGADGIGEVVFTVETAGLKYNGEYLSYSMSGNTLTATAKIDELTTVEVFTVTAVQDLDGHYDYQFNLLQEIQLESTISYDVSGAPANSKGTYFVHSDGSISAGDPTPGLTVIAEITGTGSQSKINSNNAGIGVDDNVSIGNGEAVRFDYVNGGTSSALISLGVGNNDTRDGTSYFYYKVTYQNAGVVEFTDQSFVGTQDLEIIAPIGDTILAIEIFYDNTHDDDPNNPGEAFQVFAVSSNTIVTELPIGVEFSYTATDGDNDSVIFAGDPDDGHFTIVVEPSETMQLATMSADNSSLKGLIVNESTDPSTGGEILIGTNGSDTIDLGDDTDADIAIWEVGAADGSIDTIINFDINNDLLDLSDILVDEQLGDLNDYLNITFDAVNGDTIITVDANGDDSGFDDLTIILQDTNVTLGDLTDINNLLGYSPLVVDTIP